MHRTKTNRAHKTIPQLHNWGIPPPNYTKFGSVVNAWQMCYLLTVKKTKA